MTDLLSADVDAELKARHRAMWALGNYAAVARDIIPLLGARLVAACEIRPGHVVLDVAAGTGNAAIPAALTGARVVASDLTPELLAVGERLAAERGARLDWEQGDAERLPYPDASFDAVLSCVGVMFAPHHQRAADELVRVCRPGGAIGLASWTPAGFVGRMFAAMKPFVAPPPSGAQPAPMWGDPGHLAELFGDRLVDVHTRIERVRVQQFTRPEEFRDFFRDNYGPVTVAYRNLAGDPVRTAGLDRALIDLAADALVDGVMEWEYLLFTARRS